MRIEEAPVVDVRGPITAQRGLLLDLLESLTVSQWLTPTPVPGWSVKDVALHLLDVDLSWLARGRDHDRSGVIPAAAGHEEFVRALGERNQRWINGTRTLSPRLITSLLQWSGEQLDAYLATVDLAASSSVYWAGEAPAWFNLAREFTERWVHHRQIREAVLPGERAQSLDQYLPLVLRTFIWAFPHQIQTPAPTGTTIALEISAIGAWTLTRTPTGWSLDEGDPATPAARLRLDGESAWRLLTGAKYDERLVHHSGQPGLAEPLLRVRGIIV